MIKIFFQSSILFTGPALGSHAEIATAVVTLPDLTDQLGVFRIWIVANWGA